MRTHHKQKGIAIIVALFITALVAGIAVAMMFHLQTDTRRTQLTLNHIQLNLIAAGETAWARNQLIHDWQVKQTNQIIDATPITSPINTMDGAEVYGVIQDEQGKLNLNNLQDTHYQTAFVRLLQIVSPNLETTKIEMIRHGIIDWISPGIRNSEFDQFYSQQNPPYQAPHQMIVSISELQLIKGMTPALFKKIAPYITALPATNAPININSAEGPVIMSLDPTFTESIATAIINTRKSTPFATLDQLGAQFPVVPKATNTHTMLNVNSQYFLLNTYLNMDEQNILIHTLLQRVTQGSTAKTHIIWQSIGTL